MKKELLDGYELLSAIILIIIAVILGGLIWILI